MEPLTETELKDIQYFWQEKGDLERFDFEKLIPKLEIEYPEVLKAWRDYKASIKILDLVIENLI